MPREKVIEYLTPEEIKNQGTYLKKRFETYKGDASSMRGIELLDVHLGLLSRSKDEAHVLDVGVGNGQFGNQLSCAGYKKIYGLDIDDYRSSDVLSEGLYKEFNKVDLNVDVLPWKDSFFDIATAWCVLPHLENPYHFIREAYRVIRPGGLWIISMPHINSLRLRKLFFRTGDLDRYTETNNHIAIFTPAIIKKTILKYFDLVEIEYVIDPGVYKGRFGILKKVATTKAWRGQKKIQALVRFQYHLYSQAEKRLTSIFL